MAHHNFDNMRAAFLLVIIVFRAAEMQLLPPVEEESPEPVCFTLFGTLLRRDAIAVTLTADLSDCKDLCAGKTECEAITFNSSNNKCVLLGPQSAGPCKCAKAYLGYAKSTCPSSTINPGGTSLATTSPSSASTTTAGGWILIQPSTVSSISTSTTTSVSTTSTSAAPTSTTTAGLGGWKLLTLNPLTTISTIESITAPTSTTAARTTSTTALSTTTTPYCTPASTTVAPTNVYTSLSQDPCVKQTFPALTNRTIGEYVCPMRNPDGSGGPLLVIRALTTDGTIVTVANQKSMQLPGNNVFGLSRPTTFLPSTFAPSDFVCATVDSTKCPCDPCVSTPTMAPGTACTGPPALNSMSCPGTFWFTQNGQATKDHGWYYTNSTAGSAFDFSCAAGIYIQTATSAPYTAAEVLQACCTP